MELKRLSRRFASGLVVDRQWHAFQACGNSNPADLILAGMSQAAKARHRQRFRSSSRLAADTFLRIARRGSRQNRQLRCQRCMTSAG